MLEIKLDDSQIEKLSITLVDMIQEFYSDEKNVERFNKWLLCVEKKEK